MKFESISDLKRTCPSWIQHKLYNIWHSRKCPDLLNALILRRFTFGGAFLRIFRILAKLFNYCLKAISFPSTWKVSCMLRFHNAGKRSFLSQYDPSTYLGSAASPFRISSTKRLLITKTGTISWATNNMDFVLLRPLLISCHYAQMQWNIRR